MGQILLFVLMLVLGFGIGAFWLAEKILTITDEDFKDVLDKTYECREKMKNIKNRNK